MDYSDITDNYIKIPKFKTEVHKSALLKYLLSIDEKLNEAYHLTEKYREFNRTADIQNCYEEMEDIITLFTSSSLEQVRDIIEGETNE